ncbi:ABC transporter ATP-binding protein [Aeromonas caviae]|uniref:ABC transporter ATP-binding protein n=1 Tax=Aeromonas caviae TaxID=648 RepID=UPI002B253CEB|nr:ABC transporter ATP-binding protein [Aeromonas caviae]MEA9417314.1 ABC transporter ATP-binding protein [Aeromonas caviae]
MKKLYTQFISSLLPEQKRKLYFLQFFVVVSAIFEVLSVLSVGPFMALVGNINLVYDNDVINYIYTVSRLDTPEDFLVLSGVLVLVSMFFAALTSILTIWRLSMFAAHVGSEFGERLYIYYMQKDFLYHSGVNSSELVKKIAVEVSRVTDNILQPAMQINARIATIIFISIFVLLYNPLVAIAGVLILSVSYCLLFTLVKNKLARNGRLISEFSKKRFSLMNEGFSGIKELHLLNRQGYYIDLFKHSSKIFARAYGESNSLYNIPRYIMEFIIYSSMIGLVITLLAFYNDNISSVLPVLGIFGIAAFKLLPSFQQIYSGAAQIRNNLSALESITNDLVTAKMFYQPNGSHNGIDKLSGDVRLIGVDFIYEGKSEPALTNINVNIPFRKTIGIVGSSGAGKSTIVDILIGAINLKKGSLEVGNIKIDETSLPSWRYNIGYVPQTPLMVDGTIAQNIALGMASNNIDAARLIKAIKMSQLEDWINELPLGINTFIGERGVQISGGQRQRIAIARALYNDAEYLFFDEATSALDSITEKNIMESISNMAGHKTIIMIAHRLNTVSNCDLIYFFENGRVNDHGTYNELLERNSHFKRMAGVIDA